MATLKIRIQKGGKYTITAGEGFQGTSCISKTQNIEQLIGMGAPIDSGKTDDYYKGDLPEEVIAEVDNLLS